MDLISQGIVGAAAAGLWARQRRLGASKNQDAGNAKVRRKSLVIALSLGLCAGMAADLDVLIDSSTDPLLSLEYHRHFTHSLLFAPLGALLIAGVLYLLYARFSLSFRQTYWYCLCGYATHGLLDSCTTYGTYLLWPLSNARIAWNIIAIVDPLFTLPIIVLLVWAICQKSITLVRFAALWAMLYLAVGVLQNHRAETAGLALAHSRGHVGERLTAIPAIASLLLWKSLYQHEDDYYVDGVRAGWQVSAWQGGCVAKLSPARHLPWLDPASQQYRDLERFQYFTNDYIAPSTVAENVVMDVRYSFLPHSVQAFWGIQFSPHKSAHEHVNYFHEHSQNSSDMNLFVGMLKGKLPPKATANVQPGECY